MEIILKTGFAKVTHDIKFQPETVPKGKLLNQANHVIDVKEFRKGTISYRIEARVIRQTSVTLTPYTTKLMLNVSRHITSVSCTCVYNQSGRCKHVAALIEYVNNEQSLSKTNFEQQWGSPSVSRMAKEMYSKGKYVFEMYPPKEKPDISPVATTLEELKDPSAYKTILMEAAKGKTEHSEKLLRNSVNRNKQFEDQRRVCEAIVDNFFLFKEDYTTYSTCNVSNGCEEYYYKNIVLTKPDIIKLCCDTLEQSKCNKWFEARSLRFSSSKNIHSIKSRKTKTIESLVNDLLHQKHVDCAATRYGVKNEPVAKARYEKLYNVEVKPLGLLVDENQPWLCTSLDGVVIEDLCITKIVEIKCPISCENIAVIDFSQNKSNVSYLVLKDNRFLLRESHVYYTQMQCQMYVTGLTSCDLFIYSPVENGSYCTTVFRNEEFLQRVITLAETFYFDHFLPAKLYQQQTKPKFTGEDVKNKMNTNDI